MLGVLAAVTITVVPMYMSSRRIAHSARRLSDVTLHAQSILEALAEVELGEFPDVPAGEATVLFADQAPAAPGGGPRFEEVAAYFKKPPPLEMERLVKARRLATGEMLLEIEVEWRAVVGEKETVQRIRLPMLATPRNWQ